MDAEAYMNMVMRNTAKNVAEEVQTARCKDYGVRLIEISSHSGARPKCARDQGKIYSLDNESGYTEDARGNRIRYYPWNQTSYGEPDGILGVNCRHHKYPFSPGISLQSYFPAEDMEANDRLYKQTQVQRALERSVRKQKRECLLIKELGDEEAFREASVKLKEKEKKLAAYVDGNKNLHRRRDREYVVGFDKGVSAKAISAKKHVDKYGAVRYNEDGTVKVTDDWKKRKHPSIPKEYKENAVVEVVEKKGDTVQINRTFYDSKGKMCRQIHTGPHGNPKNHPYGETGEHKHEYIWNEDGTLKTRRTTDLAEKDRKENKDIL